MNFHVLFFLGIGPAGSYNPNTGAFSSNLGSNNDNYYNNYYNNNYYYSSNNQEDIFFDGEVYIFSKFHSEADYHYLKFCLKKHIHMHKYIIAYI